MLRGNHTFKFGFDYQALRVKTFATLSGRGSFAFNGAFTQNPQRRPGSGASIADLLLGLPHSITTGTPSTSNERAHNFYWYFQENWTVNRNFTLNLGIRYELTRPFTEVENRMANFILESDDPLFGQLILAGDPQKPRSLLRTDWNNFAPRLGFAYKSPYWGMVFRGGYGIFFGQDEGFGVSQRMTNNPPFFGFGGVGHLSDQLNPASTFALSGGLPPRPAPIDPQDFVLNPRDTSRLRSWEQRYTMPYVQQWSLGIQKELTRDILWEINYVGNRGLSLWAAYEGNQPQPGPGSINDRRPLAPTYTRAGILRMEPWAASSYHGLATRLEKRFSRGSSFLLAYTFGRSLDTMSNVDLCDGCGPSGGFNSVQDTRNLAANKGPSDHNVPQRLVLSGVWRLPFGKGRSHASSGPWSRILGQWDVTAILSLSDGIPFTPALSFDNANTGTTNRPNRLRDGKLDRPTVDRYFDVTAFEFPPPFTFGNSGRNILEGPGTANLDFALHRLFGLSFTEDSQLEFRAEAFNVLNRPHFSVPGLSIGTAGAGVVGSTSLPNRQFQFGLRLIF